MQRAGVCRLTGRWSETSGSRRHRSRGQAAPTIQIVAKHLCPVDAGRRVLSCHRLVAMGL